MKKALLDSNSIELREGIYYDPVRDYYFFTSDDVENYGPISVGLQVTRRCNANCIHCAANQQIPELSTAKMLDLLEELKKGGCGRISLTGGEPLMRADLLEILKKAHSLNIAVTLSTNGLALTKKKLKQMRPFLTNIRFSLHGLESTNDRIFQKKGAFQKIISKIELAQSFDIPVGVIFSVLRSNAKEMGDLAMFLAQKKVDKLLIFTLIANGRGRDIFDKEFIHISEIQNKVNQLNERVKKYHEMSISIVDWRIEGQYILIDPEGKMYCAPCFREDCQDNIYVIGNLLKTPLKKLWSKYPFKTQYINYYRFH